MNGIRVQGLKTITFIIRAFIYGIANGEEKVVGYLLGENFRECAVSKQIF